MELTRGGSEGDMEITKCCSGISRYTITVPVASAQQDTMIRL